MPRRDVGTQQLHCLGAHREIVDRAFRLHDARGTEPMSLPAMNHKQELSIKELSWTGVRYSDLYQVVQANIVGTLTPLPDPHSQRGYDERRQWSRTGHMIDHVSC